MRTRRSEFPSLSLVSMAVIAAATVLPSHSLPAAEEDAGAILERTAAHYAGLQSMKATMEIHLELPEGLPAMDHGEPERYTVAMARPASLSAVPVPGQPSAAFVQDGERQYAEAPLFRRYVLHEAVSFHELLRSDAALAVPGVDIFLGLGLDAESPTSLHAIAEVELRGRQEVDGVDCYHLALREPAATGEIWIAAGDRPWVMRYRRDAPPPPGMPDPSETGSMAFAFEPGLDIRFADWEADPDLGGLFEIRPPEGFEQVETLYPPPEEMGAFLFGMEGEHTSIGDRAPEVRLAPLRGKAVDLSSLRGKIVVLDFWSSWCVPCVIELPLVDKVTEDLGDRGVVFFAVNRGESEKNVRRFLKEKNIDVPVVLDGDDSISSAFGVQSIPHLVIIDRTGMVREVHIGAMTGSEKRLRVELEALLDD